MRQVFGEFAETKLFTHNWLMILRINTYSAMNLLSDCGKLFKTSHHITLMTLFYSACNLNDLIHSPLKISWEIKRSKTLFHNRFEHQTLGLSIVSQGVVWRGLHLRGWSGRSQDALTFYWPPPWCNHGNHVLNWTL